MSDDKQSMRDKLRAEAPELATLIDGLREEFPDIKITYLKVGEQEFGKPMDRTHHVSMYVAPPMIDTKRRDKR